MLADLVWRTLVPRSSLGAWLMPTTIRADIRFPVRVVTRVRLSCRYKSSEKGWRLHNQAGSALCVGLKKIGQQKSPNQSAKTSYQSYRECEEVPSRGKIKRKNQRKKLAGKGNGRQYRPGYRSRREHLLNS